MITSSLDKRYTMWMYSKLEIPITMLSLNAKAQFIA